MVSSIDPDKGSGPDQGPGRIQTLPTLPLLLLEVMGKSPHSYLQNASLVAGSGCHRLTRARTRARTHARIQCGKVTLFRHRARVSRIQCSTVTRGGFARCCPLHLVLVDLPGPLEPHNTTHPHVALLPWQL